MSSFTSVPGDDGFRNYMARKIELQRRQFGLVLPPPPTQHQQEQPIAQLSAVILKKSSTTKTLDDAHGNSYSLTRGINSTKKKSVRFYENLDVDGVSQVLKNLKRKHAGEVSSRFSSADTRQQKLLRRATSNSDRESPTDSILGVLDNLQKRYGKSCLKKRRSFTADKSSKKPENSQSGSTQTTSEITLVEYDDRAAHHSYLEHDNPCVSRFTPPPKRIVESTRCKGGSFLEELEPALHDNSSQEDGAIAYDCLGQHYPEEYSHDHSISLKVSLSQLSKHSPALSADHSPPIIRTEPPSIKSPRKPNPRPDLYFIGVVVLVNGHTSPDATTLMRLLHKHGGDLEKYETQRVTHIIAEQLSVAKANIYKHQKKPTPVCRPEWITRSVESGKLLPYGDYLLENVRDRDAVGTKSVKSFFRPNSLLAHKKMDENASSLEEGSNMRSSDKTKSRHRWQDKHSSEASYHIDGQVRTIGNDPNFLESYFSNSRLSYIGSFKQRVKATKQTACRSEPVAGARKFVLLVDMDCFFASVALRKYPQYTDKPVAVGHSHVGRSFPNENAAKTKSKNSSSELSTCNYIARKRGVRKGMFLGAWPYEADLLCFASNIYVIDYVLNETSAGDAIQLCPDLVVLPYDFDGYEEVTGVVADLLHGYAEQYNGCVEQVSCDESYLEININSNDNDLGNDIFAFANSIAENIRSDILGNTACTASIGVGPNKLLAKLAADRVKPNACCVVRDWREFLHSRSLRDIPGIGRKFEGKLRSLGLCTINDVWDLEHDAVDVVSEIIGTSHADKIVKFCYGQDDRPVTPAVRKSIGVECNYGVRFNGPYGVDYMMQGLSKEVQNRMARAAVRGSKLVLKIMKSKDPTKIPGKFLGHGQCDSLSRSAEVTLTRDKDVIYSTAMKLYEKLSVNDSSIRGLGIVMNSLKSDVEVENLDSSPSKLSEWLQKDTTGTKNGSHKSCEMHETIKQDLFSLPEYDLCGASDSTAMPSFSQLDQDVLRSLPENILMEVRATYGHKSSSQISSNSPLLKSSNSGKSHRNDKPITIAGQPSVRRMLKLACIKSGDEQLVGRDLSLSQLEYLPLELQLQVANDDDVKIVKKSKHKSNRPMKPDQNDHLTDVDVLSVHNSPAKEDRSGPCAMNNFTNFYAENILPLKDFISSNPDPDSSAIDAVGDFLSLCVCERRLDDVVVFLRTIKNMNYGWDSNIYSLLRKSTIDQINSMTGNVLDVEWLGL